MRPKSIPDFCKRMEHYFQIPVRQASKYLYTDLMLLTYRIELDLFALDDYLHGIYPEYESNDMSMSEIIETRYSPAAQQFVLLMIGDGL